MLELAGSASAPRSASSAAASLHTASRLQRSARTASSTRARRARTKPPRRASAPAPFAVFVRFQFVVIVFAFLRFPAVVFRSLLRSGVRSRTVFSGPPSGRPSSEFKSVKIVFGLRFVQAPSVVRTARSRLRPPRPLRFRRVQARFVRQVPPPSVVPVYHPVPASCSARLPFVSFMVRISVRFVFVSVRFQLVSLQLVSAWSCSVRSCSFPFVLPFRSFLLVLFGFPVRFELVPLCLRPLTGDLFIYFPRILYTECNDFQMYFLAKNMCFLEIMAHFRKKYP